MAIDPVYGCNRDLYESENDLKVNLQMAAGDIKQHKSRQQNF